MMTLLTTLIICSLYLMIFSLNPVKMSIMLLTMSSLLFVNMFLNMGSAWLPMIFYLLFMGGILIVFMVISSVTPNEKTGKMKSVNTMSMMTISMVTTMMMVNVKSGEKSEDLYTQMKWFFQSNENMIFLMMIMVLYFFTFVKMLSKNKASLRTSSCQ